MKSIESITVGRNRHRAFTLVELLIVVAIIGLLVTLLLPAVFAARESARRSQCSNNMKQLGIAANIYEGAHRHLLPPKVGSGKFNGLGSSFVLLLPYLEEGSRFANYSFKETIDSETNRPVTRSNIPVYLCPSMKAKNGDHPPGTGSYIISFGTKYTGDGDGAFANPPEKERAMYKLETKHIRDGLSKTIYFGEIDNSVPWFSTEGNKKPGQWGDYTWANGYWFNSRSHLSGIFDNDGPTNEIEMKQYRTFRSDHPGGVNFCLMDGAVRFITSSVDQLAMRAAVTRNGREATALQ